VLNGDNGGLAVTAVLAVTTARKSKKQGGSGESLQGSAWEQLTTNLFKTAIKENDLNGNPMTHLRST